MKRLTLPFLLLFAACSDHPEVIKNEEANIVYVEPADVAMNKAIDKAKETLEQFKTALASKNPTYDFLSLKVRYATPDGGGEHIWLSDITFKDNTYYGIINNTPEANIGIKLGDSVQIATEDITDWMYEENGKLRGGYTIRALRDRLSEEEKKQFDIENGFIIEDQNN